MRLTLLVVQLVSLFVVLLWGLFVRKIGLTVVISAVVCCSIGWVINNLTSHDGRLYRTLCLVMIALLAIGLITEPLDGGIKKDHATLSYYFTTSAMAIMVIVVALIAERRYGVRLCALEACGANPMFAYTASGYLLTPLLTLTSLSVLVDKFANLGPWCAFGRGVLFALLVIAVTYPLTRRNYYWKS